MKMGKQRKFLDDIEIDYHVTTQYQTIIDEIDDEIQSCEQKVQELKNRKIAVGRQLLPQPLLWDLFYNQNVSPKDICEKFSIKNLHDLKNIIGSCDIVAKCGVCSKELRITVNSLTHLRGVHAGNSSALYPGFLRVNNYFLCAECYDKEMQKA